MRPKLLKVFKAPDYSFSIRQDKIPNVNNRLHYHPEVELIHFKSGKGKQFIGDNISRFKNGDLLMIGPNLSHYWNFDDSYCKGKNHKIPDVRVAHFCENFWGNQFLNLPENASIKMTLEKAKRGIQIKGKHKKEVASLLKESLASTGARRISLLLEMLTLISQCKQKILSSKAYAPTPETNDDRLNKIYEYSIAHFRNKITLAEIAQVANMSENSFCRYFKSQTGKTYMQYLIELKVGHTCKLLIEDKYNIKEIFYESGFNNTTSFHKYFKNITGKSPLNYQKEYLSKNTLEYSY